MSKFKDFINKYVTKTTVTIAVTLVFCATLYIAINQHSKLINARAELKSEQTINDVFEKESKRKLDSLTVYYNASIKEREVLISQRDKKIVSQSKIINSLQDSLKHTLVDAGNVKADSSYQYLNLRIPAVAPLKYSFDSLQVKKIYYTFLERDGLLDISNRQTILISDMTLSSSLKDSQMSDLRNLNTVYISKLKIADTKNEAFTKELDSKDKVIRQQRFLKTILIPPAVVGVVAIVKLFIK
jgi:hypothetical protein